MRAHVNFFIANKDSDTTQILDLMIEGPMDLEAELDVASSEGKNAMQDSINNRRSFQCSANADHNEQARCRSHSDRKRIHI